MHGPDIYESTCVLFVCNRVDGLLASLCRLRFGIRLLWEVFVAFLFPLFTSFPYFKDTSPRGEAVHIPVFSFWVHGFWLSLWLKLPLQLPPFTQLQLSMSAFSFHRWYLYKSQVPCRSLSSSSRPKRRPTQKNMLALSWSLLAREARNHENATNPISGLSRL